MSTPESLLIGDEVAAKFEVDATAVLACSPLLIPALETLAVATLALLEDRRARIQMEALRCS